jgi:hypothetical protein
LLIPENLREDVRIGEIEGALIDPRGIPTLLPENIKLGVTIGDVAGTYDPQAACAGEGETLCVANADFMPVALEGLAEKLLVGTSVAGVQGRVALPLRNHVLSGVGYGADGSTTGSLTLPSPAVVQAGSAAYGDPDSPTTPGYTPDFPLVSQVRDSDRVDGVRGTLADCTGDGTTGCVATASFRAADSARLVAGNIRAGVTLGGQLGEYPSASFPLADASTVPDLDMATFDAKIKSNASFEYWSSDGRRQTGEGDANIRAENILSSVSIFGLTGTALRLPCSHTSQSSCTADTACRWNGSACVLDPWNIKAGVTIAGVTGSIKTNCRNRMNSTVFNSDAMPPGNGATTAGSSLDWWDTIDMNNNALSSLPSQLPAGWTSDNVCDKGLWTDATPDGACNSAADDCMMKDNVSGLYWSESYPRSGLDATISFASWSSAYSFCNSLTFGGRSDWRLPTQMELGAAYGRGIADLAFKGGTARPGGDTRDNNDYFIPSKTQFWSATTSSATTTAAYNLQIGQSYMNALAKTTNTNTTIICVTP